jgi:hypothetical protein
MTDEKEQEFREEAERLSALTVADQREVLAIYRECAENRKLPRREREWNRERIEALTRHLKRLNRKKKSKET